MTKNNRTINMSQDVYDRLNKSLYPQTVPLTKQSSVSKLNVENGELVVNVVPGTGHLSINGEVTEKELVQIASFFNGDGSD